MEILNSTFAREIELVSQFILVLRDEQRCLVSGDISGLETIAQNKQALVESLNEQENQRRALLGEHGNSQAATSKWLAQHHSEQALSQQWIQLLTLVQEAKELHVQNGRLVEELLQRTNQAISILTASPNAPSLLYGRDGQATESSGNRIVDSA